MTDTFFSIIVLVYNTDDNYLSEALTSILNQEYNNYEVVVVDDGSNEHTKNKLKKYESKCKIIHQENMGMPASRIVGINSSKGDYIIFVDSDDYIVPQTLSIYNSIIKKHNVDIVLQDFTKFENNINNIIHKNSFFTEGLVDKKEVIKQLCMLHANGTCGRAVRKELFNDMQNYIDCSIATGEDVQQSAYVLMKANSFYYVKDNIYYYRVFMDHKNYYGINHINDCDFLTPVYNIVFKNNTEYNELLPIYKKSAVNSVIYNSFRICLLAKTRKNRKELLDALNKLEINTIIKNIKAKIPFSSNFLYFLLTKKHYFVLTIIARIYDLFNNIDKF